MFMRKHGIGTVKYRRYLVTGIGTIVIIFQSLSTIDSSITKQRHANGFFRESYVQIDHGPNYSECSIVAIRIRL
jgi:hypothetical protein